jgi:hypothetical protein
MSEMNELFSEWKKEVLSTSNHFVEDGIISQEHWNNADKKILLVLKETNDYEGNIVSLINKAINDNPKSKVWDRPTFHNAGRWVYGLLNTEKDVAPYKNAQRERKSALLSCALINVKKTTGGSRAKKSVEQHAKKYSHFIKRQIDIIQPDIIILGGTYKMIKDHVLPKMNKVDFRVHKYNNAICINANHPSYFKLKRKVIYNQVVLNYKNYLDGI